MVFIIYLFKCLLSFLDHVLCKTCRSRYACLNGCTLYTFLKSILFWFSFVMNKQIKDITIDKIKVRFPKGKG